MSVCYEMVGSTDIGWKTLSVRSRILMSFGLDGINRLGLSKGEMPLMIILRTHVYKKGRNYFPRNNN
jgi:hypothetical protein